MPLLIVIQINYFIVTKFEDINKFEQLKVIYNLETNSLTKDLNNLFSEYKDIICHFTWNVATDGIYIPQIHTKSFGTNSLKYSTAVQWNNHLKIDDKIINYSTLYSFKKYFKNFYLGSYNLD